MKILHYSLGLLPYRSGGLTKYAYDLMISEQKLGNNIYLLYPGHFNFIGSTAINKNKAREGIKVFEIVNPLPVPLLGGIGKPNLFTKSINKDVYVNFLRNITPDIIHLHTVMGLHKEFLEAAKELNIKVVYTSHDYFGFCPKVNLIDYEDNICEDSDGGEKCARCNLNSYSMKLIFLLQSRIYRSIKENKAVRVLRSYKKSKLSENKKVMIKENYNSHKSKDLNKNIETINIEIDENKIYAYMALRNYYMELFNLIDYFHFNSSIAQREYKKFLNLKGEIISISHKDIKDNRVVINYDNSCPLKITYLGPISVYKGFYLLKDSLYKLIKEEITDWKLNVYGNSGGESLNYDKHFINLNGRYSHKDLRDIFNNTDLLVIPSICKETFGFVGLEAYSYAIPIITTDNVGFKDLIIDNKTGFIIKPTVEELCGKLKELINNRSILKRVNENINRYNFINTMERHTGEIINLYERVISQKN